MYTPFIITSIRCMTFLRLIPALLLVPGVCMAREFVQYEPECREQLGIAAGKELQPGPLKAKLRDCIRDHVSAERAAESASRSRSFIERRGQPILDEVLERQKSIFQQVVAPSTLRTQYEQECRESLNIGRNEVVQPGPRKGTLLRCIERRTSQASREADLRRRRSSVQQRQQTLHENVLQSEQQILQKKLDALSNQQRSRIQNYAQPNPRALRDASNSERASVYTRVRDTQRIDRMSDADKCRSVPPEEWGDCIRKALNSDS